MNIKFMRGNDGGAYVVSVPPEPQYDAFEIGDKILKVWPQQTSLVLAASQGTVPNKRGINMPCMTWSATSARPYMKVSASFGNEIWSAESYGQVIYAIKNRNGRG
jgi:hypothetical protein